MTFSTVKDEVLADLTMERLSETLSEVRSLSSMSSYCNIGSDYSSVMSMSSSCAASPALKPGASRPAADLTGLDDLILDSMPFVPYSRQEVVADDEVSLKSSISPDESASDDENMMYSHEWMRSTPNLNDAVRDSPPSLAHSGSLPDARPGGRTVIILGTSQVRLLKEQQQQQQRANFGPRPISQQNERKRMSRNASPAAVRDNNDTSESHGDVENSWDTLVRNVNDKLIKPALPYSGTFLCSVAVAFVAGLCYDYIAHVQNIHDVTMTLSLNPIHEHPSTTHQNSS